MKAIVFKAVNTTPTIEEINISGQEGQIKLDLTHAALNHRDIWITKGLYPGLVPDKIMGADGVGYVNDKRYLVYPALHWGENEAYQSSSFKVLGVPDHGTFAEHIWVNDSDLFEVPEHLSNEEAAALPVAGLTAYRALFERAAVKSGETVLITGIGGGVALMAAQMAKAIGCKVIFTSGSEDKINRAMGLGLDSGFLYKNPDHVDDIKNNWKGIDVIIDGTAGESFGKYLSVCNYGARIVFYGGGAGKIQNLNPQPIFWKQLSILGSTMGSSKDFKAMLNLISEYKIKPVVDSIYNFYDFQQAFLRMEEGKQFGKILLNIK